jgi:hypothetical protein
LLRVRSLTSGKDGNVTKLTSNQRWIFGIYCVGQVLDILLTHEGLRRGLPEGNPIAEYLFAHIGFWPTALLLKPFSIFWGYTAIHIWPSIFYCVLAAIWFLAVVPWVVTLYIWG